ncbi:MAG: hypothetical protein WBA39_27100 [Rivularia sp. (in: cyanobacteria)]
MRNNSSKLGCYCKYAVIPTAFLTIVKGLAKLSTIIIWFELSEDYAPVILILYEAALHHPQPRSLGNHDYKALTDGK